MKIIDSFKHSNKIFFFIIIFLIFNYFFLNFLCIKNTDLNKSEISLRNLHLSADSDGDGMPDDWEINYGLNPTDKNDGMSDNDEDGLKNYEEFFYGTNPINNDTDADGIIDGYEVFIYKTLPNNSDSDTDGMPDGWEVHYGLNPLNNTDARQDLDSDKLDNFHEYLYGTFPNNKDSDSDGLDDRIEIYTYGTDPTILDTDGDGLADGWEILYNLDPINVDESLEDPDKDSIINLYEYLNNTNPFSNDTDADGYTDQYEILIIHTDPTNPKDPNYFPLTTVIFIEIPLGLVLILLIYVEIKSRKNDLSYSQVLKNFFQKLRKKRKYGGNSHLDVNKVLKKYEDKNPRKPYQKLEEEK